MKTVGIENSSMNNIRNSNFTAKFHFKILIWTKEQVALANMNQFQSSPNFVE